MWCVTQMDNPQFQNGQPLKRQRSRERIDVNQTHTNGSKDSAHRPSTEGVDAILSAAQLLTRKTSQSHDVTPTLSSPVASMRYTNYYIFLVTAWKCCCHGVAGRKVCVQQHWNTGNFLLPARYRWRFLWKKPVPTKQLLQERISMFWTRMNTMSVMYGEVVGVDVVFRRLWYSASLWVQCVGRAQCDRFYLFSLYDRLLIGYRMRSRSMRYSI